MNNGLKKYAMICVAAVALACILIHGMAALSVRILDALDEKYMAYYEKNAKGVSSPWYRDGLHLVDEGFITELEAKDPGKGEIISIGSSMSRICFRSEVAGDPYRFLVCGNGCWKSDRQLYELYKMSGAENEKDAIILEFSFSTFRNMETSITQTILDKWGRYSVTEDGGIKEGSPVLTPVYALNVDMMRLQNIWELGKDIAFKDCDPFDLGEEIPGNFINNYFNYETVAGSCNMTEEMKDSMRALIEDISSEHTLVAELSPLPKGLAATDFGRQLNEYLDEELIPYLDEQGIAYLDYRQDHEDSDFCDGVHLGYEASVRYTEKLRNDMNGVIDGGR